MTALRALLVSSLALDVAALKTLLASLVALEMIMLNEVLIPLPEAVLEEALTADEADERIEDAADSAELVIEATADCTLLSEEVNED